MRILISLMYYRPHYSGLTIYTERLARALARRGHDVSILTSRYRQDLPVREKLNGVTIYRPWVMFHVSKGVVMPTLPLWAWKLIQQAEVVNAHVPQPDAAVIAILSQLHRKPFVLTYHCDLQMPKGFVHYLANQVSHVTNHISARLADAIVTNTEDYAQASPFLRRYLSKIRAIPPPIELEAVSPEDIAKFREKYGLAPEDRMIGMAARLATEKGVEYLVQALPRVLERHPNARILFAGQHKGVLGEETYAQKLAPFIEELGKHWLFLGILPPDEWAVFFHTTEVTVLPSINSTESFGMVQIESMSCGTPVIASDLPGVRQAVKTTGMGKIVPPQDARALASALIEVLDRPNGFVKDPAEIKTRYSPDTIAAEYEEVFRRLIED
jgi:glycosyltransferase involved in cell wall biosynthesis